MIPWDTCEKVTSVVTTHTGCGASKAAHLKVNPVVCACTHTHTCSAVCVCVPLWVDRCVIVLVSNLMPFSQFMLTENDIGDRVQFTELAH